jgi:hypothetical protein
MEVKAGPFDMEEFVTKVIEPEVNPTVLLLEWQPGFVVGGFAGVPWPKVESGVVGRMAVAADREKKSFVFALEPKVQRFDLLNSKKALMGMTHWDWRSFVFGNDLVVYDGKCANQSIS